MSRRTELQARWAAMAPRERRMIAIAIGLVLLALLWWVAIGPALRTLARAPTEHARLDAQLQQMVALQARAATLQSQPRAQRDDALRALETAVQQNLANGAQLAAAGSTEGATVALRGAPADALASWLAQARGNARAVPREAHLTRSAPTAPNPVSAALTTGGAAPVVAPSPAANPVVRWDGAFIMTLPAAR